MGCAARLAWLVTSGALMACSNASSSTAADASTSTDATSRPDVVPPVESGAPEASAEAAHGGCEPVQGSCDLVLQNCPTGQQCAVGSGRDGGAATSCGSTQAAQHIQAGYPCCPVASAADDPCLPGTTCVGDPCTDDAGGGRCAPYCCAGDDTPCGSSPEGFAGHCDIRIDDGAGTPLYDVCDYATTCTPLGLLPCPTGYTCLVQDTSGGARCAVIFNGDAGAATEGERCPYQNSCADGLMCLTDTGPDGGQQAVCLLLCSTGQGTPPFDAGALGMQPGTGGCDPGKHCVAAPGIFPAWLGVCLP